MSTTSGSMSAPTLAKKIATPMVAAKTPQKRIDRQSQRQRKQGDTDRVQQPSFRISRLGDKTWHGQSQGDAEGDVGEENQAPTEP